MVLQSILFVMEIIHYHFRLLSSTNDWSKEQIETFDPCALTLVTAEEQSKGRGQYGRRWIAPPHMNLYASFCFFTNEQQRDPLSLTHLMALSIVQTLEERGVIGKIKRPNDVMVNHKKIAGILCETVPFPHQLGIVIGVGLNVNMPASLLNTIDQPATSLLEETQQEWSIEGVLFDLKKYFIQKVLTKDSTIKALLSK